MLSPTVQWLVNATTTSKKNPRRRARYLNSKMDDYIVLNYLVGCKNIFLMIYLHYQNVTKFCAFRRTVQDSKSYYIGQFQIFCTPGHVSRVICQVSGVTCQVSGVRCQVSGVTCHVSHVTCHIFFFFTIPPPKKISVL